MKYVAPEMKVVKFEAEEVIVASATTAAPEADVPGGEEW